jgi:hypothetical protein
VAKEGEKTKIVAKSKVIIQHCSHMPDSTASQASKCIGVTGDMFCTSDSNLVDLGLTVSLPF